MALQDPFLAECRRRGVGVTVALIGGAELRGVVTAFDPFTLLLVRDHQAQLVYKHAIATIQPDVPIDLAAVSADGSGSGARGA